MPPIKFLAKITQSTAVVSLCALALLPSCALKRLSDNSGTEATATSADSFKNALEILDDAIDETASASDVQPSSLDVPVHPAEMASAVDTDGTPIVEAIEIPNMDIAATDTLFAPAEFGDAVTEAAADATTPAQVVEATPETVMRQHVVVKRPSPTYSQLTKTTYAIDEFRKVRTTAYSHTEADHIKYGELSAAGKPLRFGMVRSAAADWSRYPVGTRFRIVGRPHEYVIDDYGSALVGTDTIDLYKPSDDRMDDWGVREVEIEVIAWGSFDKSVEILEPRAEMGDHIKEMIGAIEERPTDRRAIAGSSNDPSVER